VSRVLRYPVCVIDLGRGCVQRAGHSAPLTALERDLLERLARAPGAPVGKAVLLQEVWGYHPATRSRAVESTVKRLRKKIERDAAAPEVLLTVRGVGFKLAPERGRLTNLGDEGSGFFGRAEELARLGVWWAGRGRLLSLIGPGGIGKTRLARRFAATREVETWFCDLGDAESFDGLWEAVARALGISVGGQPTDRALARIAEVVAGRPVLLVLDELEQATEPASRLVSGWLASCPALRVLATSRERLRLREEEAVEVGPLGGDDALALFEHRLARARRRYAPTIEQRRAIVERLEGLPLAIELTAPRATQIPAGDLLARLDDQLGLLRGGRRDAPARHRTLRASLDWSWRLLSPPLQAALAQCGVFRAPFSLDAAEAVLAVDGAHALDLVEALCERSLVQLSAEGAFQMLRSVRAYAAERLAEVPDREAVLCRHAAWYVERGEALTGRCGPQDLAAITWLTAAREDLLASAGGAPPARAARAALILDALLRQTGPASLHEAVVEGTLRLPLEPQLLTRCWRQRATLHARRGELEETRHALARAEGASAGQRDRWVRFEMALLRGFLALQECDTARARGHYEQALRHARAVGDVGLTARALNAVGETWHQAGEAEASYALLMKAVGLLEPRHVRLGATMRSNLFCCASNLGRHREAADHLSRALADAERLGDRALEARLLGNLGDVRRQQGRVLESEALLRRAAAMHQRVGHREEEAHCRGLMGLALADLERRGEALEVIHRALAVAERAGNRRYQVQSLRSLGVIYQDSGDRVAAAAAFEDALVRAAPYPPLVAWIRGDQGRLAHEEGDLDAALRAYEEAAAAIRGHGAASGLYSAALAGALADLDRLDEAAARLDRARQRASAEPEVTAALLSFAAAHVEMARARASADGAPHRAAAARLAAAPSATVDTRIARRILEPWLGPRLVVVTAGLGLTKRETEVLGLITRGLTNRQIREALGIGLGTVKTHVNNVLRKTNARSREEAVARARQRGMLLAE